MCFSPDFGVWTDKGKEMGHNLLIQFSTLGSSKMEISETEFFFEILIIYNDETSHVKHVLDPLPPCTTGGGPLSRGRGDKLRDRPFLSALQPLYIGRWTVIAQYPLHVFFSLDLRPLSNVPVAQG